LVRGSSFSLAKTPRLPGWIDTKTDTISRHKRQLCRVNGRHGRVQLESWMLIIDWHGYPRWEKRRTTILSALSDNGLIFFGEWFYQTFDIHLVITTPKFRCTTQQILLDLREPKGRDPLCVFDRPALASNCYLNSKHFVQSQSLVGLVFFFKIMRSEQSVLTYIVAAHNVARQHDEITRKPAVAGGQSQR
jgi:hypothetical protein